MLPKILRMRRCLIFPVEVLRVASIALVAMCFPALRGNAPFDAPRKFPAKAGSCSGALPRDPLQCVRSVRQLGPCPGEDGKSSGAHVTVRRSRLFVDGADIVI